MRLKGQVGSVYPSITSWLKLTGKVSSLTEIVIYRDFEIVAWKILRHIRRKKNSYPLFTYNMATVDKGQQQKRSSGEKVRQCCSKFLVFFLSHVALTAMVIGYSLFGGWLFSELEVGEEIRQKSIIGKIRSKHLDELWDATLELNLFHKDAWMKIAEDSFIAFQTEIYSAVKKDGWDGTESGDDIQWTFTGALLFSVTTITTIGRS